MKKKILLVTSVVIGVLGLLSMVVFRGMEDEIPPNRIITDLEDNATLPLSIEEVKTVNGKTPEFTGENGSVWVITNQDGSGWELQTGDKIECLFEKRTAKHGEKQALGIGYVADGVMYKPRLYQDEISGIYQMKAVDPGEYYIYLVCASSDPITLKEVVIQTSR